MIHKDANTLGVLRFLISQIHNFEIEKKSKGGAPDLTDAEVEGVIRKEYKKRKEAIQMFKDGGRNDLAEKEEKEIAVFDVYLPKGPSEAEVVAAVEAVVGEGQTEFGTAMKAVMAKLGGQADGKLVSELVKKKLAK